VSLQQARDLCPGLAGCSKQLLLAEEIEFGRLLTEIISSVKLLFFFFKDLFIFPSTQEAEAGRFLSSRPVWSTK
jgi:hypothetical protein